MAIERDLFYRVASNVPAERMGAAVALVAQFEAETEAAERDYAIKRLINGLASNRDSARVGFSIVLTEILGMTIERSYTVPAVEHRPQNPTAGAPLDLSHYTPLRFVQDLLYILDSEIKNKGKGKQLRSYLFGALFGLQCLINSKVLAKGYAQSVDYVALESVVTNLLKLAKTKSWISEISHFTIANLLSSHDLATDARLVPFVLNALQDAGTLLTSDGLLVYLQIPIAARPQMAELAHLTKSWKHGDPLVKGNGDLLSDALKNVNVSQDNGDENDEERKANTIQKGAWSSQIHPVWIPLFRELIHVNTAIEPSSKKRKTTKANKDKSQQERISFESFYSLFQSIYFTPNTSPEKKYTGLQIVELLVTNGQIALPKQYLPTVFSGPTSRVMIDHLSKKDRVLNSIATKVLTSTVKTAIEGNRRLETIKALQYQSVFFDRLTHTKSVHSLMVNMDSPREWCGIMTWLLSSCENDLISSVSSGKKQKIEERESADIKQWILDALFTMVKSNKNILLAAFGENQGNIKIDDESTKVQMIALVKKFLESLAEYVFFEQQNVNNELVDKVVSSAKERFNNCLGLLIEFTSAETIDWTSFIVDFISQNDHKLKLPLEGELNDIKNWSIATLKALKESNDSKKLSESLELLISMALLELFSGDTESAGVLMDLKNVYEDINKSEKDESLIADETQYFDADSHIHDETCDHDHEHTDEHSDPVLDTLLDLMLSYITQKSTLKKNIATKIWETLLELGIGEPQLLRLKEILLTRENKAGMENLFNVGVDFMEEEEEEEEKASSKKILEGLSEDEVEEEEDSSSESSESEDESESDSDSESSNKDGDLHEITKGRIEEVERNSTAELAKVLNKKNFALKQEAEEEEDDDDDDSDDNDSDMSQDSMSDEQMFALDKHLSVIFKQRRDALNNIGESSDPNKKTGNERKMEAQEARDLMALVKSRVLNLLEIYVSNEVYKGTKSSLLVSMMCLETIQLTLDKIVQNKARKVIKEASKYPFKIDSDEVLEWVVENLNILFQMASVSKIQLLDQAISQVIIFIGKTASSDGVHQNLITIIEGLQNAASDESNKLDVQILRDFLGWLKSKFQKDELPDGTENAFNELIKKRCNSKSKRNSKTSKAKNKNRAKNNRKGKN